MQARTALASALTAAALSAVPVFAVSTAQAAFGVQEQNFEAATCKVASCTYADTEQAYTQAAGHPQYGITSFEFNHHNGLLGEEPEGDVRNIRVDLPPGLAADPETVPACPISSFQSNTCSAASQVGTNELTVFDGINNLTISGTVYNLQQPPGLPLDFGIHVSVEPLVSVDIYLEGHVSWSTDYHEYFEIRNVPREGEVLGVKVPLAVLKSKLIFNGRAGLGNFLTLPSACSPSTTSHLEVESWEGQVARTQTHTPVGVDGCGDVPFTPSVQVAPETAQSDQPDGARTVVRAQQNTGAGQINTADIREARVRLPEGLTLNPPAARGLQTCAAAEIAIGSTSPVSCPAASKIGTVTIETDLPPGSLSGNVYLASPGGGPLTAPPYTIYLDAESVYGVSVRLTGQVSPNPETGRLESSFTENPQLPFSELILSLSGGARAPLANPLQCSAVPAQAVFTPYTGGPAALSASPFTTSGCASPLAFSPTQTNGISSAAAGASTAYTLNLSRPGGQQYISHLETALPEGLVGAIPTVALCGEPQAAEGTCSPSSQIGTATAAVGAGPEPYPFTGPVYLTGPYGGAPYGLSIALPAAAGPFDLGSGACDCVLTRASINVDPHSARVIASAALPTIIKGVPIRLRELTVTINRPGFLSNPTSCALLAGDSTLRSTFGAMSTPSSPFRVTGCSGLAFRPSLSASTVAKTSKPAGAQLQVDLTQGAHESNIHSVYVELPPSLITRQSALQHACPEADYNIGPTDCPADSVVGIATVTTPVLPGQLRGEVYLVSHGGAAFPDLDVILEDGGVHVVLTGNTFISGGVTSTTFASIPDVPVSRFDMSLPMGPNSLLAGYGSLCSKPLLMPTRITAQNGAQIVRNTTIAVSGCPHAATRRVRILSHRLKGHTLVLRVRTIAAGRLSAGGSNLRTVVRRLRRASTVTLYVPLSRTGVSALRRHRAVKVIVRVHLAPARRGEPAAGVSSALLLRG